MRKRVEAAWERWFSPEGYLGLELAVAFVVAALSATTFGFVALQVFSEQELLAMDLEAQAFAKRAFSPALWALMNLVTYLGTPVMLTIFSLLVIGGLLRARSTRRLVAFVVIMAGGGLLSQVLKAIFARPRPYVSLAYSGGYSFPSGHAQASILFFGSLAYVLWFTFDKRAERLIALVGCIVMTLLIGASRVFLGVHYLSDVLAGYAAGLCWMAACLVATEGWVRFRDRRRAARTAGTAGPPADSTPTSA